MHKLFCNNSRGSGSQDNYPLKKKVVATADQPAKKSCHTTVKKPIYNKLYDIEEVSDDDFKPY
jgi:hypothetical protein